MAEAYLLNYSQGLVGLLVVIIGFLVRNLLSEIKKELEGILVQVTRTNGRVGVLEEWKRTHESMDNREHATISEWIRSVEQKIDQHK